MPARHGVLRLSRAAAAAMAAYARRRWSSGWMRAGPDRGRPIATPLGSATWLKAPYVHARRSAGPGVGATFLRVPSPGRIVQDIQSAVRSSAYIQSGAFVPSGQSVSRLPTNLKAKAWLARREASFPARWDTTSRVKQSCRFAQLMRA